MIALRYHVSVPIEEGSGWTFDSLTDAVNNCASRLEHGVRLLDRRTGTYLDPATGKADQ